MNPHLGTTVSDAYKHPMPVATIYWDYSDNMEKNSIIKDNDLLLLNATIKT